MKISFYIFLLVSMAVSACSTPSSSKSYYQKVRASEYPYPNPYKNNRSVWGGSDGDYAYNERRRGEEKERFLREEQDRLRRVMSEKDTQIAELRKELMELKEYLHKVLQEVSKNKNDNQWSIDNGKKVYQGSEHIEQEESFFIYASTDSQLVYPIELTSIDTGEDTTSIRSPVVKEDMQELLIIEEPKKEQKEKINIQKKSVETVKENPPVATPRSVARDSIITPKIENAPQGIAKKSTTPVKPKNEKDEYAKALQSVYAKKYNLARELFDSFIIEYPKSELMPNVLYWKGETFYGEENYVDAITTFKIAVNEYPQSNKAPDALLKMIMSYVALQDKNNAEFYRKILLEKYSKSLATEKVKKLFF